MRRITILIFLLMMSLSALAKVIPNEYIVKLKNSNKVSAFNKLMLIAQKSKTKFITSNTYLISASDIQALKNDTSFEYIEPNYLYSINNIVKTDPLENLQWAISNTGKNEPKSEGSNSSAKGIAGADLNLLEAWKITKGGDIKIAVIDTGVNYKHEDLKDNIWVNTKELNGKPGVDDDKNGHIDDIHGYDFGEMDSDPMDEHGHGTHVAGIIGAKHNKVGIKGVMDKVKIVAVKFMDKRGFGDTASAIKAIDYAIKMKVTIMNNSWGGAEDSRALEEAVKRAERAGIIFVAAAGNSKDNTDKIPLYPASYKNSNVISVAAHNYSDSLATFSSYGEGSVHIAAPGRNILSTDLANSYTVRSGTSMAAPYVAGVLGLYRSLHPNESAKSLKSKLLKSSVFKKYLSRNVISGGRANAYNILKEVYPSRPVRPNESEWKTVASTVFETEHPYRSANQLIKKYHVPGAKFMRVIIEKFDIEENYDVLKIYDASQNLIEKIDGKGSNYKTRYLEGERLSLVFTADKSVSEWGFVIKQVQYIR